MRHAARQASDGLHLLRLAQLFLEPFALCGVDGDHLHRRPARVRERTGKDLDRHLAAVEPQVAVLGREETALSCQHARDAILSRRPVLRMDERGDRLADEVFRARGTEQAHGGRIGEDDPALLLNADGVGGLVDQQAIARLTLAQGLLRAPAVGDVLERPVVVECLTVLVSDDCGAFADVDHRTVPAVPDTLKPDDLPIPFQALAEVPTRVGRLEPGSLEIALDQVLKRGEPQQPQSRRIGHQDPAVRRRSVEADAGVLVETSEALLALAQCGLRAFALRDVAARGDRPRHPSGAILEHLAPPSEKALRAILPSLPALDVDDAFLAAEERPDRLVRSLFAFEVMGGPCSDDVLPKELKAGGVRPAVDLVGVDLHNDVGDGGEQGLLAQRNGAQRLRARPVLRSPEEQSQANQCQQQPSVGEAISPHA